MRWTLSLGLLGALALLSPFAGCVCGHPGGNEDGGADGGGGDDGGGPDGGGSCLSGVDSFQVTPASSNITVTTTAGGEVTFTAVAQLSGGGSRDVTGLVSWEARRDDDTPPGTINAGRYSAPAAVGGSVQIRASDTCGHWAEATLQVTLNGAFNDPGPSTTGRFSGTVVSQDATHSPTIVYPSDQVRFPRNIYKILFQWQKKDADYFRLTFSRPGASQIEVYSNGQHTQCSAATTAGCWQADSLTWQAIASAFAGTTATLVVDGVVPADSRVYRSAPIEIGFSRRDVRGAIFYWSTTSKGIRRASISDADPESYLVALPIPTRLPGGADIKCVACHTVSRSGRKLFGYTETTTAGKGLFIYDVERVPPPTPAVISGMSTARGFGAFSPDDTRVVATVGKQLVEFDARDAGRIATLPPLEGTNPDWSPDGQDLVYSDRGGDSPGGANLSLISRGGAPDGGWGGERILVPAAGLTNIFPSYSHDGTLIAYARGKGGHGDKTLQLFLLPAQGGAPVELVAANRVVNNALTTGQYENNMPTWAPSGDLEWIAFNSLRPYGVVYPNGGTQQIWVAAVDRSRLDGGADPSFPAFRFAFQDLQENNHRAFWTEDVRYLPDAGSCMPLGALCGPGLPACCTPSECLENSELSFTCRVPSSADAGACIPESNPCNQTSGEACCLGTICDIAADGGFTCTNQIN